MWRHEQVCGSGGRHRIRCGRRQLAMINLAAHNAEAEAMHRLHSFGMTGRVREKPGCAWAALPADWGNRPQSFMPAQPWQALPL